MLIVRKKTYIDGLPHRLRQNSARDASQPGKIFARFRKRLPQWKSLGLGWTLCSLLCMPSVLGAADQRKGHRAEFDRRFKELDLNRDGKIEPAEFPEVTQFDLIDLNGDGFLSSKEARNYFEEQLSGESVDSASRTGAKTTLKRRFQRLKPADFSVGRIVPDVPFLDIERIEHRVRDFKSFSATVVAATSTSCPLSKRFLPTLARLQRTYDKDVLFVFVNSTPTDSMESIRASIQTNALNGIYVVDSDGSLLKALGATTTTDCFVIDKALTLCYRGAVDDQYGIGYSLPQPKQSLLVDALDAVLSGRVPAIEATDAPGCLLNLGPSASKPPAATDDISPTFHNRVSRILQANCVECHREGGVAPFSLTEQADVSSRASMIAQVVNNGTMPPWFAAPPAKGKPSLWSNDRSLSASDKSDLVNWLEGSQPLGDPTDAPVPSVFIDAWNIGEPDAIVQLPQPVNIPADGVMSYQQIVVPTNFDEDKWVRGFDIRPTARQVVHHVGVFVEAGPQPEKMGDEAEGSGAYLALYVPGNNWRLFPTGFAKRLPKGARLRFQIHYTPNGIATQDQTQLGLVFSKQSPRYELHMTGIVNRKLEIPPHAANHKESGLLLLPNDIQILSFLPHMHVRGKAFRIQSVSQNGAATTLLDVPRYDFNWQLAYDLNKPCSLPKGTTLKATGWFDNSAKNPANPDPTKTVRWGPQTYEEMLLGYIEYIVPAEDLTKKHR